MTTTLNCVPFGLVDKRLRYVRSDISRYATLGINNLGAERYAFGPWQQTGRN